MNIAKHPPCAPNCPMRGMGCHADCEKYTAWKAELQRISAVRDREKQTDQGVTEVQLHRKEWLRKRGYTKCSQQENVEVCGIYAGTAEGGLTMKEAKTPARTCADCIHEYACKCWTCGRVLADGNAARCPAFETAKDSAAYLIGFIDGQKVKEG